MTGLVAVPVYNEAGNVEPVIQDLLARFPIENLLFIDDGSTDDSHLLLEKAGVSYLRHPVNLGYEETLKTAMRQVLRDGQHYVVFFDSDGQHRVEDLERIGTSFNGVTSCYAIQAGREIRVMVSSEVVSDDQSHVLAKDIARKIENEMTYPGQIRVNVIRETRATDYAK